MASDRAAKIRTAILERALTERSPVAIRHVCLACADTIPSTGVGASSLGKLGLCEPLYGTDVSTYRIAELQLILGDGPAADAVALRRPVFAGDLSTTLKRWPLFAPAALDLGIRGLFTLPIQIGAMSIGVFQINRTVPGLLAEEEHEDARLFANATLLLAMGNSIEDLEFPPWAAVVHQAAGMVSVQLAIGLVDAMARLRAHAYVNDLSITEVSRHVVTRRLIFRP